MSETHEFELRQITEYPESFYASRTLSVRCPDGQHAVGGGFDVDVEAQTRLVDVLADEALAGMRGWRAELTFVKHRDPKVNKHPILVTVSAICTAAEAPPAFSISKMSDARVNSCTNVCTMPTIGREVAVKSGVPGTVNVKSDGSRVISTVYCRSCRDVPRRGGFAAARRTMVIGRKVIKRAKRGPRIFAVRITPHGKRVLKRNRRARLLLKVTVEPRRGRPSRSSARIRLTR